MTDIESSVKKAVEDFIASQDSSDLSKLNTYLVSYAVYCKAGLGYPIICSDIQWTHNSPPSLTDINDWAKEQKADSDIENACVIGFNEINLV